MPTDFCCKHVRGPTERFFCGLQLFGIGMHKVHSARFGKELQLLGSCVRAEESTMAHYDVRHPAMIGEYWTEK